jgi:hypothetical protein
MLSSIQNPYTATLNTKIVTIGVRIGIIGLEEIEFSE